MAQLEANDRAFELLAAIEVACTQGVVPMPKVRSCAELGDRDVCYEIVRRFDWLDDDDLEGDSDPRVDAFWRIRVAYQLILGNMGRSAIESTINGLDSYNDQTRFWCFCALGMIATRIELRSGDRGWMRRTLESRPWTTVENELVLEVLDELERCYAAIPGRRVTRSGVRAIVR